jgi:hypothetical protein
MNTRWDNEGYDDSDDYDEDCEEDEFESFDCAMSLDKRGKPLGCGKAGSEECDFECPYARLFGW